MYTLKYLNGNTWVSLCTSENLDIHTIYSHVPKKITNLRIYKDDQLILTLYSIFD